MSSSTTNMSLTSWAATDKFDYVQLASNWTAIDTHDHSTGKGVKISGSGIALNTITSANISNGTITQSDLGFTATPVYRNTYSLPKTQTYSTGTITLDANGTVTGTGTVFDSSMVGATLTVGAQTFLISDYTSSTVITVLNPNSTVIATTTAYSINYTLVNDTQVMVDSINNKVTNVASLPITVATPSGTAVTYTTGTTPHLLFPGQEVTIVGVTGATTGNFSGTFTVTATNAAAYTFTVANTATGTAAFSSAGITNVKSHGAMNLRYLSAIDEWDYLGGSPISTKDSTGATPTLTTGYVSIGSIVLPYAGVYNFSVSGKVNVGTSTTTPNAVTAVTAGSPSTGFALYTSTSHGLTPGQTVTIAGASVAGYNGTFLVISTPSANTFVVGNATTGAATFTSGTATYVPTVTVYLQAGPSTPGDDNLALHHTAAADLCQSRAVSITTANTTYNLYVRASNIAGTPTVKNWAISATPIFLTS